MAATRKLSRLALSDDIVYKMAARNLVTAKDVLSKTEMDLMELLDIPLDAVREVVLIVSRAVCPPYKSAGGVLEEKEREGGRGCLATHLVALDEALYGGIPTGAITELVGPAGHGKTQFCLMSSLFATLPREYGGLDGSVIYIDTENKFTSQRLVEIAQSRFPEEFRDLAAVERLTSQVLVVVPSSASEVVERLEALGPLVIARRVRLIVLDSVAALVRSEFGRDRLRERQELLSKQASILKYLAELFRIPVLVTNQVMTRGSTGKAEVTYDFVRPGENQFDNSVDVNEQTVVSALGTKWSHCVNIRLILESFGGMRYLKIAKAPMAPCVAFAYKVTQKGLELDFEPSPSLSHSHTRGEVDAHYTPHIAIHEAHHGGPMTIRHQGNMTSDGMMDYC